MNIKKLLTLIILFGLAPVSANSETLLVQQARKEIQLTGYTRSVSTVNVSSEVTGKVEAIYYDVGEVIREHPFFQIDATFIDFKIESARQSIEKLNITMAEMNTSIGYLEKEFNRIDTLHKGDRATEVQKDSAANKLQQAQHELEAVNVEKALLNTQLKELLERKKRHNIYAPQGWRVVRKNVEVGEIININTPLAKVSDYRRLVVPLSLSTNEYEALKRLKSPFDAYLEQSSIKAELHWFNPEFDEKTRKLGLELLVMQYSGENRGGLRFKLPLTIATEGLLVPQKAVSNRYANPKVILDESGESVQIIILSESNGDFLIAENPKLLVGTRLRPQ